MSISPWVDKYYKLICCGGLILDLACGSGRHGRFLLGKGFRVVFLDNDVSRLHDLRGVKDAEIVKHDLEGNSIWPLSEQKFDAVLVTNYLYRPLFPYLLSALKEDGILIYETFTKGNEKFGRPKNPSYLLDHEELIISVRPKLRVIAFQEGYLNEDEIKVVQRIVAVNSRVNKHYKILQ